MSEKFKQIKEIEEAERIKGIEEIEEIEEVEEIEGTREVGEGGVSLDVSYEDDGSEELDRELSVHKVVSNILKSYRRDLDKSPEEYIKIYQETNDSVKKKEIKEKLIGKYIQLIASVALKVSKKFLLPNEMVVDLISEGIIAFHNCLDKFDCNKGTKFSTYLYRAVYSRMCRSVMITAHLVRNKSFLYDYRNKSEEDKYEYVRITDAVVHKILFEEDNFGLYLEDVKRIVGHLLNEVSPRTRRMLEKIMNNETLTEREKKEFNKMRRLFVKYIKNKFKVDGLHDIVD
jgi:DNA-directed RNA polymerase sigma subunit (sigma70/sigma32)